MSASASPAKTSDGATIAQWQAFALTFVAYLLTARLGLLLAIQPGNASPLFPAAGVALAAAFVWGWPALLAVALAACAASLWSLAPAVVIAPAVVATWGVTALGAAAQAALGAWALRRFVAQPLLLSEPSDVARFMLLVVPLACLTSASVALVALLASGTVGWAAAPTTWAAWWVGDTLGVLIGAPVVWSLIGAPRAAWAPRRWSVALPLVAATLVMTLGIVELARGDQERAQQAFMREAENASRALAARLQEPLHALEAMRGVATVSATLDRDSFRRATLPWTAGSESLAALGLSERIARSDVAAFEARERAAGATEMHVVERWGSAGGPPTADDPLVVIRFIEPIDGNAPAIGLNARSVAGARAAIDSAARSGQPTASAGLTLAQGGRGVVVYQALYRSDGVLADERERALRGVVFATLRPDRLLGTLRERLPATLGLCLIDKDATAGQRVLAGPPSCDSATPELHSHEAAMAFAGRQWALRAQSAPAVGSIGIGRTWPLALISLAGSALLGALLLTITGRARRIESAVAERTAELEQRTAEFQAEAAQRLRTASALRDSQNRLRNILDHTPIGVAYTDTEGKIREANPHLRELLGRGSERLAGTPIAALLHPEDRAAEAQARARLLAGEVPMAHWHLRCISATGETVFTRASVSVLRGGQGEARRMVWVIENITEHLALEEAQRARKGAEAANRAKSEFLSRMSHELRTPLNALLGFTQLLELDRKQVLARHQLEWTAQMRQAGWHLLHMINDTLDLSRIESGHVELEPRALDLPELVESARTLLQHNADKRRVTIEVHLGLGARAAIGDATRVKQILTNLLSNAIKYNHEGGSVIVSSRLSQEGRVALDVIDTGPGMATPQLAQLFQPFNRLGREGGSIEGTGIGLVISLRLAELMGGALHAKSTVGMGSTFTLELPRAAVEATPSQLHDDVEVEPATYRRRTIHYVEDNETNAEVMRGILALRPQVVLEISTLGLDGLAAIKRQRPSLVLLDMQLPDIDGLELLRHLQASDETAEIPIIVVSADATESRIAEAIAAGATHYLTKPVNVPQFLAAVDSVLEQLDTQFG